MARKRITTIFAAAAAVLFIAPAAANAQVYTPNELSDLPRIESPRDAVKAIENSYPRALRAAGVGGRVQVAFVVRADGTVDPETIQVTASDHEDLARAATEAVAQIRFRPGKKDGSPVDAQVVIPITYSAN